MKKETLEKTKERLNNQLQEVEKQIQKIEDSTQELGYKNFKVHYIRRSWKSITVSGRSLKKGWSALKLLI